MSELIDLVIVVGVGGTVEEAKCEQGAQQAPHVVIDLALGDQAAGERRPDQGRAVIHGRGHLQVKPVSQRDYGLVRGLPVADHGALESPVPLEDVGEQGPVLARPVVVDAVVGTHDGADVSLPDRRLERGQVDLPKGPLIQIRARVVLLPDGVELPLLVVATEVLDLGDHAL